MSTVVAQDLNEGALYINCELDLDTSAAITATRGTGVTAVKNGTGQYDFTLKGGSRGIQLVQVLERTCDLSGTPATAFWAKITSGPTQSTSGTTAGDITWTVKTLSNAGTPAAADTTGACQLSVAICLRVIRDPASAPL